MFSDYILSYFSLASAEYIVCRHVTVPSHIVDNIPRGRLLSEAEWRGLGIVQSRGWQHYALHRYVGSMSWPNEQPVIMKFVIFSCLCDFISFCSSSTDQNLIFCYLEDPSVLILYLAK